MRFIRSRLLIALPFFCGFALSGGHTGIEIQAQAPGSFRHVGTFKNVGLVLTSVIGPGTAPGSQRLYASICYYGGSFDILSIDPDSGATTVLQSPVPGETAVWGMVVGPDGNVYMGTAPNAHFLKVDTAHGTLVDLGVPSSSELYIWAVAFGSDHRLYGGTYPHGKLVRYDPSSGRMEDLGRLDPIQQYVRYLAATNDGFIYAGMGSAEAKVVAYQISSGKMEEILPEPAEVAGFAHTYIGDDANVYGLTTLFNFRITGWDAAEIPNAAVHNEVARNVLSDGRVAALEEENGALVLHVHSAAQNTDAAFTLDYDGEPNQLFRMGLGPDGKLYGSGALPSDLVRINEDGKIDYIGRLGDGEAYSILPFGSKLMFATYADLATLIAFNPGQPFSTDAGSSNPALVTVPEEDACWRPETMVAGSDGKVYVGAQAGYGKLTGPFIAWNPKESTAETYWVAENQSVVSLTAWKDLIVGGTTIEGGAGSTSMATDAELFTWDPQKEQVISTSIPVRGAHTITDLVAGPNGLVYGFSDDTLFEFDPSANQVVRTQHTALSGLIYNSAGMDRIGRIWGLSSKGVFVIDTAQFQVTMMGAPPHAITGGFAFSGGTIDLVSGSEVYAYAIPGTLTGAVTVSSSSEDVGVGNPVTLTAAVASMNGLEATGQIDFFSNGTRVGTATLMDGQASLITRSLDLGMNKISAGYSGDSYFVAGNSGDIEVTNRAPSSTSITLPAGNAIAGSAVTLTVTISPMVDAVAPTGTVQFFDNGKELGSAVAVGGGSAVLTTYALGGGTHDISAAYSGDADYEGSSSAELAETVLGIDLKNPTPSASVSAGSSASFTLNVAPQGGFQGTVSLSCAGLPRGTACSFSPPSLATSGSSHLTISTTGAGATAALSRERNSILGIGVCLLFIGMARRRRKYACMLLAVIVLQTAVCGCGVKLTPDSAAAYLSATPPGTYSISVTASGTVNASSITQTTVITLTVN